MQTSDDGTGQKLFSMVRGWVGVFMHAHVLASLQCVCIRAFCCVLLTDGALLVHGLANHVDDAAQRAGSDGHLRERGVERHGWMGSLQERRKGQLQNSGQPDECRAFLPLDGVLPMLHEHTWMGAPLLSTFWPRTRPSVESMAMVRTELSPMCCDTSSTRRFTCPCTSRALRMEGRPLSNRTSTTGPMTCSSSSGEGQGAGRVGALN